MKLSKPHQFFILLGVMSLGLPAPIAMADEDTLFHVDKDQWTSFGSSGETKKPVVEKENKPNDSSKTSTKGTGDGSGEMTLIRPIELPTLPRMNARSSASNPSANEDNSAPDVEIVTDKKGALNIQLPVKNWKDPAKIAAKLAAEGNAADDAIDGYTIALPRRPINLPSMPSVNNGYQVQVNSTTDDSSEALSPEIVTNDDGVTDIHLREQNWQIASEIARSHARVAGGFGGDMRHSPLNVRLSFLPNDKVAPLPTPERKARPRLVDIPMNPKPVAPKKPAAECAAVDLYKKRQLEAIQSDRQTLEALQSAINELGLQNQLNFMTGAKSTSLDVSGKMTSTGVKAVTGTP